MVSELDIIYDFFEDPERAVKGISARKPVFLGVLAYAVAGVSLFFAGVLGYGLSIGGGGFFLLVILCLWQVILGFFLTAIVHMIAGIRERDGSASGLFVLFGLSGLAWTLAVPLALLWKAFYLGDWLVALVLLCLLEAASLWLKVRSIRDNYRIPVLQACAMLVIPYVAMAVFVFVGSTVALWIMISQIISLFS